MITARSAAFRIIIILSLLIFAELILRIGHGMKESRACATTKRQRLAMHPCYDKPGADPDSYDKIAKMQYSAYLGYMPLPGFHGHGYSTNSSYFRCSEEFGFNKVEREFRVFVTGGSFAWGTGVAQPDTLCQIAQGLARKDFPGRKIRVVTAGVGAYCTTQERLFVTNWILNFSPDMIVMVSGWNDAYYGFLGQDSLLEQDYMGFREKVEAKGRAGTDGEKPRFEDYALKTHYYLDKAFYKLRQGSRKDIAARIEQRQLPLERVTATLLRNIDLLSDASRRYGFRLVFVLQPSLFTTQKTLSGYERSLLAEYSRRYVGFDSYNRLAYAAFRKALAQDSLKNGYEFYDADEFISNVREPLFIDYVHFGDRGYRIMGEALYGRIIKKHIPHE